MTPEAQLLQRLAVCEAVLVTVQSHRGSVPREAGAWMAVFADDVVGTIGGGHLEWQALAEARSRLAGEPGPASLRYALGASLGQCCGGEVWLQFERLRPADLATVRERFEQQRRAWARVALFGAGHVGRALVQVLAPLPVLVHWIDSREAIFPATLAQDPYYPGDADHFRAQPLGPGLLRDKDASCGYGAALCRTAAFHGYAGGKYNQRGTTGSFHSP